MKGTEEVTLSGSKTATGRLSGETQYMSTEGANRPTAGETFRSKDRGFTCRIAQRIPLFWASCLVVRPRQYFLPPSPIFVELSIRCDLFWIFLESERYKTAV